MDSLKKLEYQLNGLAFFNTQLFNAIQNALNYKTEGKNHKQLEQQCSAIEYYFGAFLNITQELVKETESLSIDSSWEKLSTHGKSIKDFHNAYKLTDENFILIDTGYLELSENFKGLFYQEEKHRSDIPLHIDELQKISMGFYEDLLKYLLKALKSKKYKDTEHYNQNTLQEILKNIEQKIRNHYYF